ncbi:MAG: AAA family ATPase [Chlamydiia bacterium]|nr:AAA family ATPase [Chlamydiia bacterium]MCP5508861.1 AAA family ATPase [Chlamydiales bacterium]
MKKAFFIASTGQHVGKTTTCLGLVSGLNNYFQNVGFQKPVGQEHVEVEQGLRVDKDVVLFKETFQLQHPYQAMSPVLFPRGFTRDYLDGKIDHQKLISAIELGFNQIAESSDCIVVEGTGHIGVGSICDLNNAAVAKLLGLDVIIIASGGLGSSFDALALNKALCDSYGIKIKGVILNRVLQDKRTMIENYFQKALSHWNIPLLGTIPFDYFLSNPTMKDFEVLFNACLLSGEKHHLRHFRSHRLIATPVDTYKRLILPNQLMITPASREDVIAATIDYQKSHGELLTGFVLTGDIPPSQNILEALKKADIPMLYTPVHSYKALKKITSYTVKIQQGDIEKIQEAITLVEKHLNFDMICAKT